MKAQSNFVNLADKYEDKEELRMILKEAGFEFYEVGKSDLYYKKQHKRNNIILDKLWDKVRQKNL